MARLFASYNERVGVTHAIECDGWDGRRCTSIDKTAAQRDSRSSLLQATAVDSSPPPIDLDWPVQPVPHTPHTSQAQPSGLAGQASRQNHGIGPSQPASAYAGPSQRAGSPSQSTSRSVSSATAPAQSARYNDTTERARCATHHFLLSNAGICPRCQPAEKADARWVYLLLAGTFFAIFSIFLATRFYRFAREFRDEQNDTARTLLASAGARSRVVVYTTKSCPACKSAKAWLGSEKIEYVERLVDSDDTAMLEFSKLHSRSVPTFLIDGEVIIGLNPARIQAKLSALPSLPPSTIN